jgi:hypothetical protein
MKHLKLLTFSLILISSGMVSAQNGGTDTYEFLDLTYSARVAALGGSGIAVKDNDPNLALQNPALLNKEMDNQLTLNYTNYFTDINYGYSSFTKHFDSIGTFNLGMRYVNYGSFTERDAGGNEMGTFNVGEYAIVMGYGRELNKYFSIGANLNTILSSLYDYNSFGMAIDLGGTYYKEESGFTASLVFKNMGAQFTTYEEDNREPIPFEIQAGISKRLKNVPLRFSLIAHSLETPDLTYENQIKTNNTLLGDTEEEKDKDGFFENVARHAIVSMEFIPSENFNIRFGYNYQRRRELLVEEKTGLVGFSFGVGLRISKFHLSYGRAAYHQAGATNTFSLVTRISDFYN